MTIKQHAGRLLAVVGLAALVGCQGNLLNRGTTNTWPMSVNRELPAAGGKVRVTSQKDSANAQVRVEVERLAPPSATTPGATTYVVWLRPSGQDDAVNMGAMRVDDNLKGRFETQTPFRQFEVFITAEKSATVTEPSGQPLLGAQVQAVRAT